ncbi:hypothetical protein [uncultured Serinicoccus sp.]|uniref:hypothetical protein n=1 Tax=uncultured Serinicoccus sp. TaxID=735514 RepID=UPI00261F227D|nr:hypothetical protein [uncultured Serinicoccus sp.]
MRQVTGWVRRNPEGRSRREPAPRAVADEVESLAGRAVGGVSDAWALLVVRMVRRLWIPCLILGVAWVVWTGTTQDVSELHLATVPEIVAALLSPFVGVVLALGLRVASTALGVVAALPVARADLHHARRRMSSGVPHIVSVAIGLRWLRATTAARDVALSRLRPAVARTLLLVDRVQTALIPVAALVLVVVVAVAPG